jgi:hypothetical protein
VCDTALHVLSTKNDPAVAIVREVDPLASITWWVPLVRDAGNPCCCMKVVPSLATVSSSCGIRAAGKLVTRVRSRKSPSSRRRLAALAHSDAH